MTMAEGNKKEQQQQQIKTEYFRHQTHTFG
jgi:hypothetical protein